MNLSVQAVRRYYEQNTKFFLAAGLDNRTRTIHRAVWADGVTRQEEALNYTNQLLLAEVQNYLQGRSTALLADLGCGVGGSLFYLAQRLANIKGVGLTLSPTQAQLAQQHNAYPAQCFFIEGNYLQLPLARADLAFSIEAFLHAPDPQLYFEQIAHTLSIGGRLILCDDFLSDRTPATDDDRNWLAEFQRGWHAPAVQTMAQVTALARARGLHLCAHQHLTPHLRLLRLPSFFAHAFMQLSQLLHLNQPLWLSLTGGLALQVCLAKGLVEYHFLVFEKEAL